MNKNKFFSIFLKILFSAFCLLVLSSCSGSILCTNKKGSKQGILFNFDPVFKTVDIGSYPTMIEKYDWVKKLIVSNDGFFVVSGQKTLHCDNFKEINTNHNASCKGGKLIEKYSVHKYTEKEGYQQWVNLKEEFWKPIQNLNDNIAKNPNYHYKHCSYAPFGGLQQILGIIKRI